MPAITGMKGEGFYDRHSAPQGAAIQMLAEWMAEAATTVALPPAPRPVVLVDFGSSEGRNAIAVMRAAAATIRQRTAQPIQTIYSDLPSNNFNQLFANLNDPALISGFPTEVYPGAAPGSFYRALLPPGTVQLATCFNSILWMDRLPAVSVPDFVSYRRPLRGLTVAPEVEAAFTCQAATDLENFLQARAREMTPGGKLLVASPGDTEQHRCCDGCYDSLNDACLDLVANGRIERARYERLTLPVHFRTAAELVAPLKKEASPLREAFALERAETMEVPTPFEREFERTGNAAHYAAAYTGFLRAFTEPVVRAALVGPGESSAIVEAVYARVAERIAAEPARYRFRYFQVAALLTRRGSSVPF